MKKLLAVLLAALMLGGGMAVGVSAYPGEVPIVAPGFDQFYTDLIDCVDLDAAVNGYDNSKLGVCFFRYDSNDKLTGEMYLQGIEMVLLLEKPGEWPDGLLDEPFTADDYLEGKTYDDFCRDAFLLHQSGFIAFTETDLYNQWKAGKLEKFCKENAKANDALVIDFLKQYLKPEVLERFGIDLDAAIDDDQNIIIEVLEAIWNFILRYLFFGFLWMR